MLRRLPDRVRILGDDDGYVRDERRSLAARRLRALVHGGNGHALQVRQRAHPGDGAVGQFAAEAVGVRPQGRGEHLHLRGGLQLRLAVQPLAVKLDRALLEDGVQDGQVLPQVLEGPYELEAVRRLHRGLVARADAELQPAGSQLVDHHRALHHGQGVAGEGGDDRGAEPDLVGVARRRREDGEGVGSGAATREPGRVHAGPVRRHDAVDEAAGVAREDVGPDCQIVHVYPFRSGLSRSLPRP